MRNAEIHVTASDGTEGTANGGTEGILTPHPRHPGRVQPEWLPQLSKITATGEVWEMHDVYGGRFAVIAAFSYPGGMDPSVFLYDIDACGAVRLLNAGVFDDVARAAQAWREFAGDAAAGAAQPTPVDTPERLRCLTHWDDEEDTLNGDKSQSRIDN